MNKVRFSLTASIFLVSFSALTSVAPAQLPQTFVSATGGSDSNPCDDSLRPCRTIQGAITKAQAGREVVAETSSNYQAGRARADLLVASFDSFQMLRYDDTTGAFLGTFATGLPNYRPIGMTVGAEGNQYVGMNNFGPPFESLILRFDSKQERLSTFSR